MTRSLNQTGRRAVFAAIAACAALAGTLGLASGAQAALVFASTRQSPVDGTSDFEIWKANNDGTSPVQLTNNNTWDERPSLDDDGTKVVFASKRDGNWEIYRMNADGSNQTRLTDSTNKDTRPVWSPDGDQIAWQRQTGGDPDIWIMDEDGDNKTQLTANSAIDIAPAWGDGGIAFVSNRPGITTSSGGSHDIYKVSPDGSNLTQLTSHTENEFDPSWWDSGAILYTRNLSSSREIYEVDAANAGIRTTTRITNTPTRDECDPVRRSSSTIAFTNLSVGAADLWRANRSNGTSAVTFENGASTPNVNTPTTNDQQLAFEGQ